jgi:hypothetical protein
MQDFLPESDDASTYAKLLATTSFRSSSKPELQYAEFENLEGRSVLVIEYLYEVNENIARAFVVDGYFDYAASACQVAFMRSGAEPMNSDEKEMVERAFASIGWNADRLTPIPKSEEWQFSTVMSGTLKLEHPSKWSVIKDEEKEITLFDGTQGIHLSWYEHQLSVAEAVKMKEDKPEGYEEFIRTLEAGIMTTAKQRNHGSTISRIDDCLIAERPAVCFAVDIPLSSSPETLMHELVFEVDCDSGLICLGTYRRLKGENSFTEDDWAIVARLIHSMKFNN